MDIKIYEDKMEKSLANLEDEYTSIRAGRANPRILDKIQVDYYGTMSSLQKCIGSGGSDDPDSAMGEQPDQRY